MKKMIPGSQELLKLILEANRAQSRELSRKCVRMANGLIRTYGSCWVSE